jgi:hypothetical protein
MMGISLMPTPKLIQRRKKKVLAVPHLTEKSRTDK